MPDDHDDSTAANSSNQQNIDSSTGGFMGFWIHAWVGIILAGAIFGFFVGWGIGVIPGAVIAGFLGVPIAYTCAVACWALWLTRFSIVFAAIAGGWTGALSVALLDSSTARLLYTNSPAFLAALAGSAGGGGLAYYYSKRYGWPNRSSDANGKNIWQFSLRDLFLRFTAVSVLIAVWTTLLAKLLR